MCVCVGSRTLATFPIACARALGKYFVPFVLFVICPVAQTGQIVCNNARGTLHFAGATAR